MNNVVRTAIEALAAVLGGTQSLHTNALDEVLALPTEEAATLALRTQQIIAFETGVPAVADPLGGSYFVEALTDEIEGGRRRCSPRSTRMGGGSMLEGVLRGVETGWFTQRIAEAAFEEQRRYRGGRPGPGRGERVRGARRAAARDPRDPAWRPRRRRSRRSSASAPSATRRPAETALGALVDGRPDTDANLIEPLVACARARCTGGEVTRALQQVFGTWRETPAF